MKATSELLVTIRGYVSRCAVIGGTTFGIDPHL